MTDWERAAIRVAVVIVVDLVIAWTVFVAWMPRGLMHGSQPCLVFQHHLYCEAK